MTTTETKEKYAEELAKFNQLFANRYTDEDKEYVEMTQNRSYTPPVTENWPQNNQYRSNRQFHRGNQFRNDDREHRNYSHGRRQNRYDDNRDRSYRNHSHDHHHRRERSRSPPHHRRHH